MRFILTLAAAVIIVLTSVHPGLAQTASGSLTGTVTDMEGAPIVGASVNLRGASSYRTVSDQKGAFRIASVSPGVYSISIVKAGFNTAAQGDVIVLTGQTQTVAVRLERQTFSSLRTIASVRVGRSGSINTSPASVDVITAQTFIDQGQPQVTRVLSQVPGVQISFPSNGSNAAAPGAITIPNIRAATSYETASLIDGHPISVGQYGDNVTTFLNSFLFGSVEVIKGPGAESPVVNNAIGGTTNFRTKDPTQTPVADVLAGLDSRGGSYSNVSISDTIGKLGFVVDVATLNDPSALNGKTVLYDPSFGVLGGSTLSGTSSYNPLPPTASNLKNSYSLLACCYTLNGNLDQTGELAKLRYQFSPSTFLTASYLGGQSYSDQNGNTSGFINSTFAPGAGYTGSLQPGAVQVATIFPGAYAGEINNEPIFQAEAGSTIGKDSVLARYYHATISRFQYQGTTPAGLDYNNVSLYGSSAGLPMFNGTSAAVGFNDFYQEPELDRLSGGSIQYQHPIGANSITFSADKTYAQTTDYIYNATSFQPPAVSSNLPPGTAQILGTYLLRGHFYTGARLESTIGLYLNTYSSTYPINCPMDANGFCTTDAAINGTGVTFQTTKYTHFDPRFGFVYRPSANTSVRLAFGSSIAPPFLGLLNQITSVPAYDATNLVAIEQQSNGNLRPETGFGYDIGADVRLKDGVTIASADVYRTNLFNRFFGQTVATGQACGATFPCSGNAPPGTPILNQTNTNISNARFEGIEFLIRRTPQVGLGYALSGALQRGYYYNLPPGFYCSIPGPGCTQDQNLNVLSGQNTNGVGVGVGGLSYNGNMRIPYSQGYAELNYRFANGMYASFGETYFGNNNSLNEPAFAIANATVRVPLTKRLDFQISGDNMFNAYPGYLPVIGGGIAIPLADGTSAATTGNVLGPATYRFLLHVHGI